MLRWLKTVVVSDRGNGAAVIASGGDREDVPEAPGREIGLACVVEASKLQDDIETEGPGVPLGMSLADTRLLARWCPA